MPVSITSAQSKALSGGFLDTLGSDQSGFGSLSLDNTANILLEVAGQFVQDAHDNLNKDDKVSSGRLIDSIISLPLQILGTKIVAQVKAADYYDFINKGVKGTKSNYAAGSPYSYKNKQPPVNEIRKWLIREGIRARNIKKGITHRERKGIKQTDTSTATAWRISKSIQRKGIKASHYWDKALFNLKANIKTKISAQFKVDVQTTITKT